MRILVTTEFYLPFQCGVTASITNEMKALEALGHEVRVLTIGKEKRSFYSSETKCWYIRSNFPQLYKDSYASIATKDKIVDEVIAWSPDIIHSQSEFFSFLFAKRIAKALSVPIVHTCHTDFEAYAIHFTSLTGIWNYFASKIIPLLIRKADRLICSTDKIFSLIRSYRIKKPVDRIMVGLDLDMFSSSLSSLERVDMRKSLGIGEKEIVFLSTCRLSEEKGVDEVITLFSKVKCQCGKKLLVVGDGTYRPHLEALSRKMGLEKDVIFIGFVPPTEIWKYYRLSDIYIGASCSETQCLSYVEAMASSLPILVRDDYVLDAYVRRGKNAFVFESEEDFLEKVSVLIESEDVRERLGREAEKDIASLSLSIFAEKLLASFAKALGEKKRG